MADGNATATVKYGKDYDAPWFVASGTPAEIKQQLVEFYGLDAEGTAGNTPHEVFLEAVSVAKGSYTAAKNLGGSLSGDDPVGNKNTRRSTGWPGGKKAESEAKKPEHQFQDVLDAIEVAKSTDELGRLWAQNKAAFNNADVSKAAEEKAKSFA